MNRVHWQPDLSSLGVGSNASAFWSWVLLSDNDPRVPACLPATISCDEPLSTNATSMETAGGKHYFNSRLFLAEPKQAQQKNSLVFCDEAILVAEAPKHWLFGPQGEEICRFIAEARTLGDRYWNVLEQNNGNKKKKDTRRVRVPDTALSLMVEKAYDRELNRTRRHGAVVLALSFAEQEFYGHRTVAWGRDVSSSDLAYAHGFGSKHFIVPHSQPAVAKTDNALRWLVMRDELPAELYQEVAAPWRQETGRFLHPLDQ